MIQACTAYLEGHLKQLGIKKVYTRAADSTKHQSLPYAKITINDETLRYDGSQVAKADGPNASERTFRRRLYHRIVPVDVEIVAKDQQTTSELGAAFLAGLKRRIWDSQGNAVLVSAEARKQMMNTSLLSQQSATYFTVTFEGGLYQDRVVKVVNLDTALQLECEFGEV